MKSKDRKRFSHRIDMWDDDGENVLEHLAGVEDFDLAMATYRAACLRWPGAAITIRQGARMLEDSRKRRLAWAMTLVIQRAEHRDTQAIHAKLDEILHALGDARNEITRMDEEEPEEIERRREHMRKDD